MKSALDLEQIIQLVTSRADPNSAINRKAALLPYIQKGRPKWLISK
jgi:hypothetical protein